VKRATASCTARSSSLSCARTSNKSSGRTGIARLQVGCGDYLPVAPSTGGHPQASALRAGSAAAFAQNEKSRQCRLFSLLRTQLLVRVDAY
jgi:hypothetical protein